MTAVLVSVLPPALAVEVSVALVFVPVVVTLTVFATLLLAVHVFCNCKVAVLGVLVYVHNNAVSLAPTVNWTGGDKGRFVIGLPSVLLHVTVVV